MLDFASLKASDVLQAMVTGLLKSDADPLFEVNMGTYGKVQEKICYGCCATLTLAEMFGKGKSASEMMLAYAKTLQRDYADYAYTPLSNVLHLKSFSVKGFFPIDLRSLEQAVDSARKGKVSVLIELLTGEFNESFESFDGRWELDNCDWEEFIPTIEATIAEMAIAGY